MKPDLPSRYLEGLEVKKEVEVKTKSPLTEQNKKKYETSNVYVSSEIEEYIFFIKE